MISSHKIHREDIHTLPPLSDVPARAQNSRCKGSLRPVKSYHSFQKQRVKIGWKDKREKKSGRVPLGGEGQEAHRLEEVADVHVLLQADEARRRRGTEPRPVAG